MSRQLVRAVAYRDTSETEYSTVLDKIYSSQKLADEALSKVFAHVKFTKIIEVEE